MFQEELETMKWNEPGGEAHKAIVRIIPGLEGGNFASCGFSLSFYTQGTVLREDLCGGMFVCVVCILTIFIHKPVNMWILLSIFCYNTMFVPAGPSTT